MASRPNPSGRPRRAPTPLDERRLEELALRYVGRFATTRAKLRSYLQRKLRERGWRGAGDPAIEPLVARFADLGYVDDAAFALSKSRALAGRGYGKRRLDEKLRHAGVEEADAAAARALADNEAVAAALRFAERRRIGPFGSAPSDPRERDKALAAMVRAGHAFGLARAICSLAPGADVDLDSLADEAARNAR